jgi:hypothetical protein
VTPPGHRTHTAHCRYASYYASMQAITRARVPNRCHGAVETHRRNDVVAQ